MLETIREEDRSEFDNIPTYFSTDHNKTYINGKYVTVLDQYLRFSNKVDPAVVKNIIESGVELKHVKREF